MYKNILVMTDFSEDSNYAAQVACEMAKKFEANLYILHVAHISGDFTILLDEHEYEDIKRRVDESIKKELSEMIKNVPCLKDIKYKHIVRRGIPYEEGLKEVKSGKYDLLVVGSHGKSNVTTFFYGSTTAKLTRRSPISVHMTRLKKRQDHIAAANK